MTTGRSAAAASQSSQIGDAGDGHDAVISAIKRAARRAPEFSLSCGPAGSGYVSCLALARDRRMLARWMARQCVSDRTMDRKCQAAYLIGNLAKGVIAPLAELYLEDAVVPRLSADATSIKLERYRWRHGDRFGLAVRARLRIDPGSTTGSIPPPACLPTADARRDRLRDDIVALFVPLVENLHLASRLGRKALWRLVADMTVYAFLNAGRRLGEEDRARAEALLLIRSPGSPLDNRQTGYVEIVLPDADRPGVELDRRWFIARGGCCRYYTLPKGEFCSVCVLRPADERQAMLREHLAELHAAAG